MLKEEFLSVSCFGGQSVVTANLGVQVEMLPCMTSTRNGIG